MSENTILAISLFFHLLATVIWIGGLLLTVLLVWPEVRRTLANTPELYTTLTRFRKRFVPFTNLSLAVLIFTGLTQMALNENYEGMLDFSNSWSQVILVKHIVIVGMVAAGAFIQYGISPALERTTLLLERGKGDPADYERLQRREVSLTWLNAGLGVVVLACSAYAGTL